MKFLNVVWFLFGYILRPSPPVEGSFPRVSTPLGRIIGFHCISKSGRRYEAYEGIRYAQPPIGKYRFQVARSVSPWKGLLIAKRLGTSCLQYGIIPSRLEPPAGETLKGSEDCLYLNIYTADSGTQRNLLPVIFFIHGGAFQFGCGAVHRPKYLLDRNVTLVTFNYRLGPLGFLSTEDETVPGNMGLKDQVIALRWVKDNIRFFGGDPSNITIVGQSAGGASVHYHYLSKLSSGLFQRGMSLSGTALNCWAQTENPLEKAKRLATILGCPTDNVRRMIDCLREKPADQITHAVGEFMPFLYNPFTPFGPVVEKGGGEFTFIDRSPIDVITSGDAEDVPWITSNVSEEGLFPAAQFIVNDKLLEEVNQEWSTVAPYLLDFNYTVPHTDHAAVAEKMKHHYLGTRGFGHSTADRTVQMISDRLYLYDGEKAARLQARANRSPVRYYYFSYRGSASFSDLFTGNREDLGVSHTDDLLYVLKTGLTPAKTPRDRKMQQLLIDLWVSFATDGVPDVGVDWRGLSRSHKSKFRYLHIAGPRNNRMEKSSNFGNKKFWSTIDFQENIPQPSNSSSQSVRKIAQG